MTVWCGCAWIIRVSAHDAVSLASGIAKQFRCRQVLRKMDEPQVRACFGGLGKQIAQSLFGKIRSNESVAQSGLGCYEPLSSIDSGCAHLVMQCRDCIYLIRGELQFFPQFKKVCQTGPAIQLGRQGKAPAAATPQLLDVLFGQALDLARLKTCMGRPTIMMSVVLRKAGEWQERQSDGPGYRRLRRHSHSFRLMGMA
jgi:hypothetical protein